MFKYIPVVVVGLGLLAASVGMFSMAFADKREDTSFYRVGSALKCEVYAKRDGANIVYVARGYYCVVAVGRY